MPRTKPPRPPLTISGLYNQHQTGYQPVSRTNGLLPQPQEWLKYLHIRNELKGDRRLVLIRDFLAAYHHTRDQWRQLSALGQIYFLADHWMKNQPRGSQKDPYPTVHRIFRETVDKMCMALDCGVNVLPTKLEEYWGALPSYFGFSVDRRIQNGGQVKPGAPPKAAEYLDRAEADKYRLRFIDGVAYQVPWWRTAPPFDLVVAESNTAEPSFPPNSQPALDHKPGFAGFILSMDREIYIARHAFGRGRRGFFHSAYTGGCSVLCAGFILIQGGAVKAVTNASGHYMPAIQCLTNVIQTLQMYGVVPHTVQVTAVAYSWKNQDGSPGTYDVSAKGDKLLKLGERLLDIKERKEANDNKKSDAGWKTWQDRTPPRPPRNF
jgi:hypothetical protein